MQALIKAQKGSVTDSTKILGPNTCNPGAPDLSMANGGHPMPLVHVVGATTGAAGPVGPFNDSAPLGSALITGGRFNVVGSKDVYPRLPVTSAGSLALGPGGDLRFSWTTTRDASSTTGGVLRARMEIDRKDCWAAVGFSSSSTANMVGADFLVGERDLHTHVPAVNAYKYWKASEPIPVPTGNGSSVRLLATEMTATGSVWIFERDLVPADPGQTAIQGKVNLIWATCDWSKNVRV